MSLVLVPVNVKTINPKYNFEINGVSYIGQPIANTVMYVSKKVQSLLDNLKTIENCLVFAEDGIKVPEGIEEKNCLIFSSNPSYDYAMFVSKLAGKKYDSSRTFTLQPEGWYKGENVTIGKDSYIESGCVIGHDVSIGNNAVILAGSKIRNAQIGDNVLINENAVIGANGFTMASGLNGEKIRIPTLGKVIIGNNVEIGALDNISSGSASDTIIHDYVKLDALVSVGHNDEIGLGVSLPAGVILAGYDNIGSNTFIGINSSVKNRTKVGANCMIGMGSIVNKDVKEGTTFFTKPTNIKVDSDSLK